jgi:5-methylcytosine-specific restriction protein A
VEIHDSAAITFIDAAGSERSYLPEEIDSKEVHTEGAGTQITVNAYERDPAARIECLAHHGYRCAVCEKSMREIYGVNAEGIIHVHHRTLLHTIGKEYEVDPIKDPVPVCPNCHTVLHRQKESMAVKELRIVMGLV